MQVGWVEVLRVGFIWYGGKFKNCTCLTVTVLYFLRPKIFSLFIHLQCSEECCRNSSQHEHSEIYLCKTAASRWSHFGYTFDA